MSFSWAKNCLVLGQLSSRLKSKRVFLIIFGFAIDGALYTQITFDFVDSSPLCCYIVDVLTKGICHTFCNARCASKVQTMAFYLLMSLPKNCHVQQKDFEPFLFWQRIYILVCRTLFFNTVIYILNWYCNFSFQENFTKESAASLFTFCCFNWRVNVGVWREYP